MDREPEQHDEPAREVGAGMKPELLKRVYLRGQDFDRHDYTASCPACHLIRMVFQGKMYFTLNLAESEWLPRWARRTRVERLAAAKLKNKSKSELRAGEAAVWDLPDKARPVPKRATEEEGTSRETCAGAEEAKRAGVSLPEIAGT